MGRNMESSLFCTQCIDCFDMHAIECSLFCIQCFDCLWQYHGILVYFVHRCIDCFDMHAIECSFYFAYNVSTGFDVRTIECSLFCTQCIDCFDMLRLLRSYYSDLKWSMVGKPLFSAFQNFFRIENPLNIKKVMGRKHVYQLYRHNIAFEPLKYLVLWSLVSTVSTWDTTHNTLLSMLWS